MSVRVQIGRTSEHVAFEVAGPSSPDAVDVHDRDWTAVGVEWAEPGFQGRFQASAQLSDFRRLATILDSLHSNLDGAGDWTTFEGDVRFRLVGDGLGHIEISADLIADAIRGPRVSTLVSIDQTEIPRILASLRDVERLEKGNP